MDTFKTKAILLCLVFISLFSIIFSSSVSSQSENIETPSFSSFDEVFNQYLISIENYNQAYEEYILKRAQYLRFKTLRSQQDAQVATTEMLQRRDDVVISYLLALRARLGEAIAVSEARKEGLTIRIDEEVSWYLTHKEKLTSARVLDDLVSDSNEAKERLTQSEGLFYEILSTIAQGKIVRFTERTDEIFLAVKNKVEEIRADAREGYSFSPGKFNTLDRWLFEAQNLVVRSKTRQTEADDLISELVVRQGNLLGDYNQILATLGESQLYLKETSTFLEEVIREIKTAEE